MTARFQIISPAPRTDDRSDRAAAPSAVPPVGTDSSGGRPRRRFTWRFLAANNRSLAAAAGSFPDAASCIAAIHEVKRGLTSAECEFIRDEKGLWTWVVRVDRTVVASTHRYPRQLRARMTCENFFALASDPAAVENVHVVYR